MYTLLGLLIAILTTLFLGIGSARMAIESYPPSGMLQRPPWSAQMDVAVESGNAYIRAAIAKSGHLPLGAAEGMVLTAREDSSGQPLNAACAYRIAGPLPLSRFWSLVAYAPGGQILKGQNTLSAISSRAVLQQDNQGLDVIAASRARPGNWIPMPSAGSFVLVLRLYDLPPSASSDPERFQLPEIRVMGRCDS